jgi:hypothetical protein
MGSSDSARCSDHVAIRPSKAIIYSRQFRLGPLARSSTSLQVSELGREGRKR